MLRIASVLAVLLVATTAAAAAMATDGDRITICHKADGAARTMEVAASSWHGHEGHGDHKGACTAADANAAPGSPVQPGARPSPLSLQAESEGDLDGDAVFRVRVDHDHETAHDVRVEGLLAGDGRWTVEPTQLPCTIDGGRLTCAFGDLAPGDDQAFRLRFDGPTVAVCREVTIDLQLMAANDATAGDDRAESGTYVGACSALDPWDV